MIGIRERAGYAHQARPGADFTRNPSICNLQFTFFNFQ